MTQFRGKATEFLDFGSVKLFAPPKAEDCGTNQNFCQPTEQGDNITFQFLAAETSNLVSDGDFPDGSHNSICGIESWCGQGWGIVDNEIVHQVGAIQLLDQSSIFTINNFFKITVTVTNLTGGGFIIINEGDTSVVGASILSNGTFTFFYVATAT